MTLVYNDTKYSVPFRALYPSPTVCVYFLLVGDMTWKWTVNLESEVFLVHAMQAYGGGGSL